MRGTLLAIILSFIGVISGASPAWAGEGNFLVLPVNTDLQRAALGGDNRLCVCVLVNGKALLQADEAIRWKALDFDTLTNALVPLRKNKKSTVIFHVIHDAATESNSRVIGWTFAGFGRYSGFED